MLQRLMLSSPAVVVALAVAACASRPMRYTMGSASGESFALSIAPAAAQGMGSLKGDQDYGAPRKGADVPPTDVPPAVPPPSSPAVSPPVPPSDGPQARAEPPHAARPATDVVSSVVPGAGCPCDRCPRPYTYINEGFEAFPGVGAFIRVGRVFGSNSRRDHALEIGFSYQDLWDEFSGEGEDGKLWAVRLGMRTRSDPCGCRHWMTRLGASIWDSSGQPRQIDFGFVDISEPGSYAGAYASLGYEWDRRGPCEWSHGVELELLTGFNLDGDEFAVTPVVRWYVSLKF